MEYKDINKIEPGSYIWRTPSPASEKFDPLNTPRLFKWDYKTPYKGGPYYLRRKITPNATAKDKIYTNIKFDAKDAQEYSKIIPEFKSNFK
jgi:hypothetical protein